MMIRTGKHFCIALPLVATLSACVSSDGRYPSLAERNIERFSAAVPAEASTPSEAKRVEHQKTTTIALNDVVEAHKKFTDYQPEAARLINAARGLGNESDNRAKALIALAVLQGHHSAAVMARSRLDELTVEEAIEFGQPFTADLGQAKVEDMLTEQAATLDSLSAALGQ